MFRIVAGRQPLAACGRWLGSAVGRTAHRRAAAWAAVAVLAVTAAGCVSQAQVPLPGKPSAGATAAALARPRLTAAQQAVAAYQASWQAYAQAMSARSAPRARETLAPYYSPQLAASTVASDQRDWAAHDIAYGSAVTHVLSVRVRGRTALVHDCLDLSQLGAQDDRTGQVVPGSFGQQDLNSYITLGLSGGRWLVRTMQPVEVPCAP